MISYVDHQLYVGDQMDAESPPAFISAVLWTAPDIPLSPPPGLAFGRLPLKEYTEPDLIDLQMGVEWLDQRLPEHQILVACRLGFGRSPSVTIAYLCCVLGLSYKEAEDLLIQKRPGTTPLPRLDSLITRLQETATPFSPATLAKTF